MIPLRLAAREIEVCLVDSFVLKAERIRMLSKNVLPQELFMRIQNHVPTCSQCNPLKEVVLSRWEMESHKAIMTRGELKTKHGTCRNKLGCIGMKFFKVVRLPRGSVANEYMDKFVLIRVILRFPHLSCNRASGWIPHKYVNPI
jgi:hypothetical protein